VRSAERQTQGDVIVTVPVGPEALVAERPARDAPGQGPVSPFVGRWTAARTLELLVWCLAAVIGAGLPAMLYVLEMQFQRGTLQSIAEARSEGVSQRIAANPQLWRFEQERLQDILKHSVVQGDGDDRRSIVALDGTLVAESKGAKELASPVIEVRHALYDAGREVASLQVQRSLRPVLLRLLGGAFASVAVSAMALAFLKWLPLRALRRMEVELEHKAYHDQLTGLYNREAFRRLLDKAVLEARRHDQRLAVMFIDLDRFKSINDTLGHDAGDQVLRSVAERLRASVRDSDVVARLSGDEFAIVIENIGGEDAAAGAADALLRRFEGPFELAGRDWYLSCSVGLSLFPTHAQDSDKLLAFADTAMLHAKSSGRSSRLVYSEGMQDSVAHRVHIEDELRGALERNEFVLQFQPLVSMADGRISGAEALLRWQHPRRGMVPPVEFIAILEDLGLIHSVGRWVLVQACRQLQQWRQAGLDIGVVAVNVSALQFGRAAEFVDQVRQALQQTGLPPRQLQLELTEGVLMSDSDRSLKVLGELERLGVTLAIDDFGTGYSSLAYLRSFPVSTLKVDRSFVRNMCADAKDASIVKAVVQLAHSLNLQVTAEGIETPGQLAALNALGCDVGQGYLLGRPMAAAELAERMRRAAPEAVA